MVKNDRTRAVLLGFTVTSFTVRAALGHLGLGARIVGIFDPELPNGQEPDVPPWSGLSEVEADLVVICDDTGKERLLRAFAELSGASGVDVVLAGMAHLDYRDPLYAELDAPAMVPSYATGHPHTRVHIFQFLQSAAAAGLQGAVVELGAFKGGTTAWLAKLVDRFDLKAHVIGFDSWAGFPPRRSILDLYTHPRCVFTDVSTVRAYLEPLGVELVVGDIADTAPRRLEGVSILLAFVDTDNYSGSRRALETIVPNLVPGGAVILDHYWTTPEYLYTIGERMAAQDVLGGAGLLQVHGTGVFVKLR
jgi:predicted O-methyltransferase YrrM